MSRKPPPTSKLERPRPLAYARRQKTGSDAPDDNDASTPGGMPIGEQLAALAKPDEAKSAVMKSDKEQAKDEAKPAESKKADEAKAAPEHAKTGGAKIDAEKAEGAKPDPAKPDASKADDDSVTRSKRTTETPPIEDPASDPWRSRADTALMPPLVNLGAPPEVPAAAPTMPQSGATEGPTFMPGPRDVPAGDPNDPASPPGRVPRGDSRSLRRGNEFVLVYRVGTFVISRFGTVGTRGQWRVVEYPTSNAASHAYAKESSRFVSEGFSDYRDY